jgi:putative ATPase
VVGALLSRAAVYVLEPLTATTCSTCSTAPRARTRRDVVIDADARELLIDLADGDARRLLNTLEIALAWRAMRRRQAIDAAFLRARLPATLRRFDKGGESFYDQISALHKSVRGSDPDAALYWMVRMLDGGVDPRYVARRVVSMAVEDIGLADPRALQHRARCRRGLRAARFARGRTGAGRGDRLSGGGGQVQRGVRGLQPGARVHQSDGSRPVPMHLRNAPTRLMKDLDYGKGYRYAHDEAGGYAAGERYLPDGVPRSAGIADRAGAGVAPASGCRSCAADESAGGGASRKSASADAAAEQAGKRSPAADECWWSSGPT